jgi:hypothetical protein
MSTNLQIMLTKSSTESEIKAYFQKVLELKQSGDEFPVNLDLVWPLVYTSKKDATDVLKREFLQLPNYQSLGENPERLNTSELRQGYDYKVVVETVNAGHTTSKKEFYFLSVPCMEYFIARKVRPVFEVYRQVFHRVMEQTPLTKLEALQQVVGAMVAQERRLAQHDNRISQVEEQLHALEAKTATRPDYFTIVGYGNLHQIPVDRTQASSLGRAAAMLCRMRGIQPDKTNDYRFGTVGVYPKEVLEEVFSGLMRAMFN